MSLSSRHEQVTGTAASLCRWFVAMFVLWLRLVSPVAAGEGSFVGSWRNIDADTSGITRIEIRQRPDHLELNPFGRCHPDDCDWGWRPAQIYHSQGTGEPAALLAEFKFGSGTRRLDKVMTLRHEQGLLRVETFTVFGDERKPYWAVYHFKTKDPLSSTPVPAASPVQKAKPSRN